MTSGQKRVSHFAVKDYFQSICPCLALPSLDLLVAVRHYLIWVLLVHYSFRQGPAVVDVALKIMLLLDSIKIPRLGAASTKFRYIFAKFDKYS